MKRILGGFVILFILVPAAFSQVNINENDSGNVVLPADNNIIVDDTSKNAVMSPEDSIRNAPSKYALEARVKYKATDSIRFNIKEQKVYLFHEAQLIYTDINLDAHYIEIDLAASEVFATGRPDSTGKIVGKPHFTDGGSKDEFVCDTLKYNFKSKKGYIKGIITQQGDGFMLGDQVMKLADNSALFKNGKYTTCDHHDHPHFYIALTKAKVIPNDKIVSGPAYLVIEDIPTPLAIPFGFFPNKRGQSSGILIPSYGESSNRGFFLENGGYYFAINDYVDLALRGDIYSRGSWAVKAASSYKKRYKYNGNLNLSYATNIIGEKEFPDYQKNKDFFIRWNHNQDPKARPNSRFSANVNAGSSSYNTFNPVSTNDYLSNTFQSNISYQTTIAGKYNFSANFRHSQNTLNKTVDLSLPELAFSVNRFYPLRKKKRSGRLKWYENISVNYVMNAQNKLSTVDSLLFTAQTWDRFQNGIKHSIPVSSSIKILKHATWTNTLNYTERWYFQTINKSWNNGMQIVGQDTLFGFIDEDTIPGFRAGRDFTYSSSVNTRIYGMMSLKKGPVKAFRHVLTPSVSFTYRPDFGTAFWGYYQYYLDPNTAEPIPYSVFQRGIYGSPSRGQSGRVGFSLTNNLEMKVRNRKDTANGTRKIKLIDNLTLSTYYDIAKDSLNWSPLIVSGYTKLFKNLDIRYAGAWDPYVIDSLGRNMNQFEWDVNKRLFRHSSSEWAFSLNYSLNSNMGKKKKQNFQSEKGSEEELEEINEHQNAYVDYTNPWSVNIYYTLKHSTFYDANLKKMDSRVIQTLSFNGDISITPKWKVGFTSGYDFEQKDFSYTSVNIYRDLHCWEMIFNWIPTGFRKSYNLTIRVKSPILQDLKLTKKTDWRDYY